MAGFVEAFATFNAKPTNAMWACSAISADGVLVVSCWSHLFQKGGPGALHYVDRLSRWTGNVRGNNLMREHLEKAKAEGLTIRMVVATAKDPSQVEKVGDASTIKKTFHAKEDLIGRLLSFDGDNFVIEFRKAGA